MKRFVVACAVALVQVAFLAVSGSAQAGTAAKIPQAQLIQPADFAKQLQASGSKPLILQVGSHMLFTQAHIPGFAFDGTRRSPPPAREHEREQHHEGEAP